ncbi:MAG: hypothetical protein IT340_16580 [Chloroflexi bacterium]|nr:hypothetical protein [Chloroflexota bacterium]
MATRSPLHLPAWRDGQFWVYQLARAGKNGFDGRLRYTASRLGDGAWRVEGRSDYPEGRSLHEWIEVIGDPLTHRAAFFERRNSAGLYRYESRQESDGTLWLRVEVDDTAREERHPSRPDPVYIGNQLDFLLHGLDVSASGAWRLRARVESGKIYPFEVRVADRAAVMPHDGEALEAVLVTVKIATNPLVKWLAPSVRYWFHPRDQTMLLRIDHGESVLTLIDAG